MSRYYFTSTYDIIEFIHLCYYISYNYLEIMVYLFFFVNMMRSERKKYLFFGVSYIIINNIIHVTYIIVYPYVEMFLFHHCKRTILIYNFINVGIHNGMYVGQNKYIIQVHKIHYITLQ